MLPRRIPACAGRSSVADVPGNGALAVGAGGTVADMDGVGLAAGVDAAMEPLCAGKAAKRLSRAVVEGICIYRILA